MVRHYTSRAGDPHRHLHLQINARVFAAGAWRGLHSVGVVDSIEAINGIGHAAVMCDPEFRGVLAAHGYTLDPETGEVAQLDAVRRVVQRPRRADHPQHRPLRGPVAQRASRRGARADVAAGLGPACVVTGPTRQGRTRERGRAPGAVGRGAAPARLHRAGCPDRCGGAPRCRDRTGQPGRGGRPGALASGGASVELERRRHPRRGRADHRGRRRRGTRAGTPRAGRGPDRPHRRPVRAAARP